MGCAQLGGLIQGLLRVGGHDGLHLLVQALGIAVIQIFLRTADHAGGVVQPLHSVQDAAVGNQLGKTDLFLLRGCLQTVIGGAVDVLAVQFGNGFIGEDAADGAGLRMSTFWNRTSDTGQESIS